MHFHIITLFPEAFQSYFSLSMIKRALSSKRIRVSFYNPRDFIDPARSGVRASKHRRVDNRPYGGGPGMVLEASAVLAASDKAIGRKKNVKVLFLSPSGKQFDGNFARRLSGRFSHIVIIAGHYEGVDARVRKALHAEEVSIGPYTLTGGELPAMVIVDSVSRYISGVLGNADSIEEDRVASSQVYTRPEVVIHKGKKYRVPKVLLSGNHKKIEEWKKQLDA